MNKVCVKEMFYNPILRKMQVMIDGDSHVYENVVPEDKDSILKQLRAHYRAQGTVLVVSSKLQIKTITVRR
jgi:uncharacterized protein YbjQ (UPF0145 family)